MRKLQDWSGRRWMVVLSRAEGAPSLREQAEAKRREREHGVAQHPLVRSVLERFPGAEIVAVRDGARRRGAPATVPVRMRMQATTFFTTTAPIRRRRQRLLGFLEEHT